MGECAQKATENERWRVFPDNGTIGASFSLNMCKDRKVDMETGNIILLVPYQLHDMLTKTWYVAVMQSQHAYF